MIPKWELTLQNTIAGAGVFTLGILAGRYWSSAAGTTISGKKVVAKSYNSDGDPIKTYCVQHSTPLSAIQEKCMSETLKHPWARMLGAPEVITLNAALIKALGGKKVIDVGVFTGASSLAAALVVPKDGKVIACDISEEYTREAVKRWNEAGVQDIVDLRIAPATETLQSLIDAGEAGSYDFAFIDADKLGYDSYYELCLQLLRPGGIIAFDNTLWSGQVLLPEDQADESTKALKRLNDKLAKDSLRSFVVQLNVGDGYTLAVKL